MVCVSLALPSGVDIAVFPPACLLNRVINGLKGAVDLGRCSGCCGGAKQGALTGEISSSQLVDAGCKLVLVGHSERRLIWVSRMRYSIASLQLLRLLV
jgi:triosephosphate isomerase (TIM)